MTTPTNKMQPFSIDQFFYVRLTEEGKNILCSEAAQSFLKAESITIPAEDADGYTRWQLWVLMAIFGPSMNNKETPELFRHGIIRLGCASSVEQQLANADLRWRLKQERLEIAYSDRRDDVENKNDQEKRILDLHARVEALEAKQRQKPGATAELVERVAVASTPEDAIREVADWLEQQQHILSDGWTNACIYFAELLRDKVKVPQKEVCRSEPEQRYYAVSTTASGQRPISTTCRASSINDAFRKALDKIYGKSCWWRPEGPHDPEPDIYGDVWFRGYVTRWCDKANACSMESPLLLIKIKPLA